MAAFGWLLVALASGAPLDDALATASEAPAIESEAELARELLVAGYPELALARARQNANALGQLAARLVDIVAPAAEERADFAVLAPLVAESDDFSELSHRGAAAVAKGELLESSGRPDEALEQYESVARGTTAFQEAAVRRGHLYLDKEMLKSAVKAYRDAYQVEGGDEMLAEQGLMWICRIYYGLQRPWNSHLYYILEEDGQRALVQYQELADVEDGWSQLAMGERQLATEAVSGSLTGRWRAEALVVDALSRRDPKDRKARTQLQKAREALAADAEALSGVVMAVEQAGHGALPRAGTTWEPWLVEDRPLGALLERREDLVDEAKRWKDEGVEESTRAALAATLESELEAVDRDIRVRVAERAQEAATWRGSVELSLERAAAGDGTPPTRLRRPF